MKHIVEESAAINWETGKQYKYKKDDNTPTVYGTYWKDHPDFDINLVRGEHYYGEVIHYLREDMDGKKYKYEQLLEECIITRDKDGFVKHFKEGFEYINLADKQYHLLREAVYHKQDTAVLCILAKLSLEDLITVVEICQKFGYVNMEQKVKDYSGSAEILLEIEQKFRIL